MKSPLPDRERRHKLQFYLARDMNYGTRLGLGADAHPATLLVGLALLFSGTLFFLARGYDLTPKRQTGKGEWEKTTLDRFAATRRQEEQVRTWDDTLIDITCWPGFFTLLLVCGAVVAGCVALAQSYELRGWAPVLALDAAVVLLPLWFSGTRRGWRPVVLRQQIEALEVALRTIQLYDHPPCQIQPMFEMLGQGEKRTPIFARLFVRFPEGPEDLLGVQFQVSINDVQGTKYPYLYAVIVARESFGLIRRHLETIAGHADGLTVEPNQEEDVTVIVVRQHTTRESGYHTRPGAIRSITVAAWEGISEVLARERAAAMR